MTHPHTTDTAPRRHTTGRAGKAQGAPQDRGGTAPHRSTAHRRKHKRVHKSTSRCAIVVAWSTRGQTTRSYPTTPLAPLSYMYYIIIIYITYIRMENID